MYNPNKKSFAIISTHKHIHTIEFCVAYRLQISCFSDKSSHSGRRQYESMYKSHNMKMKIVGHTKNN